MADVLHDLRNGVRQEDCDGDSVAIVRCGRGDCACEQRLMARAAEEIERLRAGIDAARSGLLRVERQAEETRTAVTRSMRALIAQTESGGGNG